MGEIDAVVVERLAAGQKTEATHDDRRAAALLLVQRRPELTRSQVAERVGVSPRTVERVAKAAGLPSTNPCVVNQRAPGETRAAVKAAILADPMASCYEISRRLGLSHRASAVSRHYQALVAAGELPARGRNVRNPRWRGHHFNPDAY